MRLARFINCPANPEVRSRWSSRQEARNSHATSYRDGRLQPQPQPQTSANASHICIDHPLGEACTDITCLSAQRALLDDQSFLQTPKEYNL